MQSKEEYRPDPVFGQMSFDNHEEVVFCHDQKSGLKAIIGIHNTALGPALGGTRIWKYNSEWEALNDVLRLSRGMTFKSSLAGLNLGGGKAVIMADARTEKTPEKIVAFAKYVDSLKGKFYTAEDVGTTTDDMDLIKENTPYVVGMSKAKGGSGDPSPVTAYGVYMGMKAAVKQKFGNDSLEGKKILIQGVGHVGELMLDYLLKEGALVQITDINRERLEFLAASKGVGIFEGDVYSADVDIYSPCALGATLNSQTVHTIKATVVAGCANNQLAAEATDGRVLAQRGIIHAPDFLINAGGIINVYGEIVGYDLEEGMRRTQNIYNTTLEVFKYGQQHNVTPQEAAIMLAQERVSKAGEENKK